MKFSKWLFYMTILSALSGCVYLGPPFKVNDQFTSVPLDKQVVVGITHVILNGNSDSNRKFWDNTNRVVESLPDHKGYLGHKLRKKLFVNDAWTMTIWENDDALNQFVRGDQHRQAMANGLPAVKSAQFLRLSLPRSQTPIDWSTVEQLMKDKGRDLY